MKLWKSVSDLRLNSQSCNFGGLTESLIRDQIGIGNKNLSKRLLGDTALALDKAIGIYQAAEVTQSRIKFIQGGQFSDGTGIIENPKYHKQGRRSEAEKHVELKVRIKPE